ncbi:MAG TPA: ABC transporter substrate-binding protein [Acetobacteraceae bacterium]|nr:ABC transporter substrate-binding protein [Acetobacteraceae bacterium]
MNSTRRRLLLAIGAALPAVVPFPSVSADAGPSWAATYIRRIGDELAAIVANAGSAEVRRRNLRPFIDRVVDVEGVARFCLGRFWRQVTPAQQRDYIQVFHAVLTNTVLSRVGDYDHNEVRVSIDQPEMREGAVQVPTVVERTGNPPVKVIWVVSGGPDNPRIADVIAEGVSLRLTVRSDYNAFLTRHGDSVDALVEALRQQVCDSCAPARLPAGQ